MINKTLRCAGTECPSANNCERYTDRAADPHAAYAAFWARREASADCCDCMLPIKPVTTYQGEAAYGVSQ